MLATEEISHLLDEILADAMWQYSVALLEDRVAGASLFGEAPPLAADSADAPAARHRPERVRPGSRDRLEVFRLIEAAGFRISLGGGPHPYKVTHSGHPGVVFPFGHGRRYCREQLDNYRRGFRAAFAVDPPF